MKSDKQITRRTLLQTAVVVTPVAMTGCASLSRDDEGMPLVKDSDPVPLSMAYHSNTRDVEADNPLATTHDVSQKCANCVHQQGSASRGRLQCPTFPGRTVSTEGWCTLWAKG